MRDPRTARAERVEAEAMHHTVAGGPQDVRARLGASARRLGGGVALAAVNDPTGYWSKALGFGVDEPVTAGLVRDVCAFYRTSGVPMATVQIAPEALPADWPAIAADCGLRPGASWVKLLRPATGPPAPRGATTLRVGTVPDEDLVQWAEVMLTGFGMPVDPLAPMITASAGPTCRPFAAWDGPDMVATAALFVLGDTAAMFGASTLPSHRGRGAQSALLAARFQEAVTAGASWISAETGTETPEDPNPSLHNLRRAGFTDLYERRNWTWHRA